MNDDVELGTAIAAIDNQINEALSSARRFRDVWGGGRLKSRSGFEALVLSSEEEIEHEFFKSGQDFFIRTHIVNPIMHSLFDLCRVQVSWPKSVIIFQADNDRYEQSNPIEFIVSAGDKRVGYRYTDLDNLSLDRVSRLMAEHSIERLVVVDWSGAEPSALKQSDHELRIGNSIRIDRVTSAELFDEFFPAGLYGEFISRVHSAIRQAEEIVGYQVVPRFSIPRLASFKTEMLDGIHKTISSLRDEDFECVNNKVKYGLTEKDQAMLDQAFFHDGWGRSLGGTKGFAKCLMTSEYLRAAFRQGGEFDYTSIVCGYLKAVEQLANELMLATLGTPGSESLYMATFKKRARFAQYHRAFGWSRDEPHVVFSSENQKYFETSLVSIANLLHDNEGAWRISESGRHFVLLRIRRFAKKDRNGYFHKDNFTDYDEVQKIRVDAISLLYFLVGGYSIPGNRHKQLQVLGMENVAYDNLYHKIEKIPLEDFALKFEGEGLVKSIRLSKQPATEYDEYGLVKSTILFIKVDGHWGFRERESGDTANNAEVLEVSRQHIPSKMWYVKHDGTAVQFW